MISEIDLNITKIEKKDKKFLESQKCQNLFEDIKIAMIGNVDSGKSTLVGVLTKGINDNGKGEARMRVLNYAHEMVKGQTSSIAQEMMGFDKENQQILPDRFVQNKNKYQPEIVKKSSKIVNFFDLCGHEKYLKTTMFGLSGMCPDYAMIVIGSNMGINRMTKEHLGITLALKIPFFIVLTKVDLCPENIYQENMEILKKILKSNHVNRMPIIIKEEKDKENLQKISETLANDRVCPIFTVSNVTGEGIEDLKFFIGHMKNRNIQNSNIYGKDDPFKFDINESFMVSGVGLVISGVIKSGTATINKTFLLGPDSNNTFKQVQIKSIHINRVSVENAYAGQCVTFSIKALKSFEKIGRDSIRKGMCLLDPLLKPQAIVSFEAEVIVLHHSSTLREGYQAVMHCGVIRQTVTLESFQDDREYIRTGDKAKLTFRFKYNGEYLKNGETFLLRDGRTKIIGVISNVNVDKNSNPKQTFNKQYLIKQNTVMI